MAEEWKRQQRTAYFRDAYSPFSLFRLVYLNSNSCITSQITDHYNLYFVK